MKLLRTLAVVVAVTIIALFNWMCNEDNVSSENKIELQTDASCYHYIHAVNPCAADLRTVWVEVSKAGETGIIASGWCNSGGIFGVLTVWQYFDIRMSQNCGLVGYCSHTSQNVFIDCEATQDVTVCDP